MSFAERAKTASLFRHKWNCLCVVLLSLYSHLQMIIYTVVCRKEDVAMGGRRKEKTIVKEKIQKRMIDQAKINDSLWSGQDTTLQRVLAVYEGVLTDIWRFIWAIWTVLLPITAPTFGDTGHMVLTGKLLRVACLGRIIWFGTLKRKNIGIVSCKFIIAVLKHMINICIILF